MHPAPAIPINIRRAVAADCDAVRALLIETWHDAYDRILGPNEVKIFCDQNFSAGTLLYYIENTVTRWFCVAEADGKIIGFLSARISVLGWAGVDMLYVHPTAQRKGLDSALLETVPRIFPWARYIALTVLEPNARGVAFYERHKFHVFGMTYYAHKADIPILLMKRKQPESGDWRTSIAEYLRLNFGRTDRLHP